MKMLSLCTGIGGIDIAAEWAGMKIVGQVEIDDFCNSVLEKHWPSVKRARDIRNVQTSQFGEIDIVAGGIPCQGNSTFGHRRGTSDERYLWPEMLRIFKDSQAQWLFLENVPGILSVEDGRLFQNILQDLARYGYSSAWIVYSGKIVQAPHVRYRLFLIGRKETNLGDTTSDKHDIQTLIRQGQGNERSFLSSGRSDKPSMAGTIDGLSTRLDEHRWPAHRGERQYGWEAPRKSFVNSSLTKKRLKALGNAVVPLQAYPLLRAIAQTEW